METPRQSGDKLPPARSVGDLRLHARDRIGRRVNRPDEPAGFQPFGGSAQLGPDDGIVCLQDGPVLLNPLRQRRGVPLTVGPFDPNRRQVDFVYQRRKRDSEEKRAKYSRDKKRKFRAPLSGRCDRRPRGAAATIPLAVLWQAFARWAHLRPVAPAGTVPLAVLVQPFARWALLSRAAANVCPRNHLGHSGRRASRL